MRSPPLLLLHGALGSSDQLRPLGEALAPTECLFLDFEGHGRASAPERPFRTGHFADNVLEYLDRTAVDRVDVFGYSMGGYVALWLAGAVPGRIGRIATLGTKLAWDPAFAAGQMPLLDPAAIERKVPRFAGSLARLHGDDRWRSVVIATADMMTDLGRAPALTPERLALVRGPVLVMRGDADDMVSKAECLSATEWLPGARYLELAGTPHPIEKVSVDRLADALRAFLGEAPASEGA